MGISWKSENFCCYDFIDKLKVPTVPREILQGDLMDRIDNVKASWPKTHPVAKFYHKENYTKDISDNYAGVVLKVERVINKNNNNHIETDMIPVYGRKTWKDFFTPVQLTGHRFNPISYNGMICPKSFLDLLDGKKEGLKLAQKSKMAQIGERSLTFWKEKRNSSISNHQKKICDANVKKLNRALGKGRFIPDKLRVKKHSE